MKNAEQKGYLLGLWIGSILWLSLIVYLIYELFSRIFGEGDPFPVLTSLMLIGILAKLQSVNVSFREIVDWMRK